jgi:glycosyltransferase involved in cell wall biosynthesis
MKILMWNSMDSIIGGVEKYLHDLTKELRQHGHQVVSVYTNAGEQPRLSTEYYLPGLGPRRLRELFYNLRKGLLKREIERLDSILAEEKPDLIHINNYFTPFLLKHVQKAIPIVHAVHDYYYVCPILYKLLLKSNNICTFPLGLTCLKECCPADQYFDYVMRYFSRETVMEADRIQVFSNYMKGVLIENGFQSEKVKVIPYITDAPLETNGTTNEPLIVFAGRLAVEKGVKHLIEALYEIPDNFKAVLIGDGPQKEILQKLVEGLGLSDRVKFTGWLKTGEIHKYYRRARLVVVPSVWPEPFGIVGIEAMASAKPLVAFDVGGIPEWLAHDETGYLVPQKNINGLADTLVKLLTDPRKAEEMGRNGQQRLSTQFSKKKHLQDLLNLYQEALGR